MMKFGWEIRRWAPGLDEEAVKDAAADDLKPGSPSYAAGPILEFIGYAFASSFDKVACVANGERVEPLARPELQELANMLAFGWAAAERLRRASELLNEAKNHLPKSSLTRVQIEKEFPPLPADDAEADGK